ncbi:MAG: branched-chain amino acid transaminase [Lysobacterales bacterium]
MSQSLPDYIWFNGKLVPWAEATVHVMSHALHYGSSVFEGIRSYQTPKGPAIFRYTDHMKRLYASASIYDLEIQHDIASLMEAGREVLRANQLTNAYLRPLAWRGAGGFGLGADNPTGTMIAAWVWGPYLGAQAIHDGIDACISSWRRVAPATLPATAKAGGNYLSSILVSREAKRLGFHEGIALTVDGYLAEGAGENLFLVFGKTIYTPPIAASILHGITRDTAITLAQELGYEIKEQNLPREMIYLADEVFMTGTAAEITPIRSVDGKKIGAGQPGPTTRAIQQRFFGLFDGSVEDQHGWLEYVG